MQSAFRYHHQMPGKVSSPLFHQLISEWITLNSTTSASTTVTRWATSEPLLEGFHHPHEIVDAIDSAQADQKDAYFLALLRLTQQGQALAGRILLQLMLPKLGRIALRMAARDADTLWGEDRRQLVVAEFWDIITNYAVDRRTNAVPVKLALDTLHRCTMKQPWRHQEFPSDDAAAFIDRHPTREHDHHSDEPIRLSDVVSWGVKQSVISQDDADLMVSIYVDEEKPQQAADRLKVSADVIRKRCSRARQRLTAALADNPLQTLGLAC